MKVALLGAPGSGKTRVANALARKLGKNWRVVDGYVDRLAETTGWPYGADVSFDSYRQQLEVVSQRWVLEDQASHRGHHTITCGSIFESIIYTSAFSTRLAQMEDEAQLIRENFATQCIMSLLGVMATRDFDYDALFFLPLESPTPGEWSSVVNAKLPEVLEGQFKYAVTLTGTHKLKVTRAFEITNAIFGASQAPEDDQPAVRADDDAGEGDEHQPLTVSDVPLAQD